MRLGELSEHKGVSNLIQKMIYGCGFVKWSGFCSLCPDLTIIRNLVHAADQMKISESLFWYAMPLVFAAASLIYLCQFMDIVAYAWDVIFFIFVWKTVTLI